MSEFTAEHFIQKLGAIPEDQWLEGMYEHEGQCCALGHCGARRGDDDNEECTALSNMFGLAGLSVTEVNDGLDPAYQQHEPKLRVMAALYDLKRREMKSNKVSTCESCGGQILKLKTATLWTDGVLTCHQCAPENKTPRLRILAALEDVKKQSGKE